MLCRASLVPTAVLHSHLLSICRNCRQLPPYMLLVCHLHCRPEFACRSSFWYPLLSYIRTYCSSAVNIVDLRGYALQNLVATHSCPTFLRVACLPPLPLATLVGAARLPPTSSTCIHLPSFFGTHCCPTFVCTARMLSTLLTCIRVLQNLVGTHCCPSFILAPRLPSISLTCFSTHCRPLLVPTAVLHSYSLLVCRLHR